MDDFKILLYIVGVIAYWLFTKFIKSKTKAKEESDTEKTAPAVPSVSLDDILKQHLPATQFREVTKKPEFVSLEQNVTKSARSSERTSIKALSLENKADVEEALKRSLFRKSDKFNSYGAIEQKVHPLAALLHNKEGARNAVILSEILKRKEY